MNNKLTPFYGVEFRQVQKNESDALFFYTYYITRIRYFIAIKIKFWPLHSCVSVKSIRQMSVSSFSGTYLLRRYWPIIHCSVYIRTERMKRSLTGRNTLNFVYLDRSFYGTTIAKYLVGIKLNYRVK